MRVHAVDVSVVSELPGDTAQLEAAPRAAARPLPRSGRVIVWLLRLTGQSGGSSWIAWLHAAVSYAFLTGASLTLASRKSVAGAARLRETQAFFTAAMESSLFGVTHVLTWLPMTCTFFVGRRRYEVLLTGLREAGESARRYPSHAACLRVLNRRLLTLLAGVAISTAVLLVNYIILLDVAEQCDESTRQCFLAMMQSTLFASIDGIMFQVALKLRFAGILIESGMEVVCYELKTMVDQGCIDLNKLKHLRKCQAKLSTSFSRITRGMMPELLACMLYGVIAQVSGFLLIISTIKRGQGFEQTSTILLQLWGAAMTVSVPCEVGQIMLDRVSQTRDTLLDLPSADLITNQEVTLFLEATRRDLDDLGDTSLFRLRRSTVLAITSAVITYIIVFMQFQLTEEPNLLQITENLTSPDAAR